MAEDTLQVMTRGGVDKKYFPTQLHASSGNSSNELTRSFFSQLDKISTVKSNILKNEEKIEKMVLSIGLTHQ